MSNLWQEDCRGLEMKVIEIKNLVKIYASPFMRKKSIGLNGLNMEVEEGEIFGLLGPNGAGKTTALKIITHLLKPSGGSVTLFGGVGSLEARKRMGFLPENPTFYRHLTGMELLQFYSRLYGKNPTRKELEEKLKVVGLKDSQDRRISGYSKGMLQRIGLIQTLIGDPDLLVLDEPLSGLDPVGRREMKDLIRKVNMEGKTVLFSSHILSDVEAICNRVGIIVDGKMKKVGHIGEILKSEIRYIDIEFEGMEEIDWLNEYGDLKKEGKVIYLRTEDTEKKDKVLKEISRRGGRIISVVPQRQSLEEHFIRTLNE